MKSFIIAILVLILAISAAVFGFKYWQAQSQKGNTPTLEKTLTGVLLPAQNAVGYSDVISVNGQLIGVTSDTINLKPYENRNVKIMGQYSGSTMYADSVTIIP